MFCFYKLQQQVVTYLSNKIKTITFRPVNPNIIVSDGLILLVTLSTGSTQLLQTLVAATLLPKFIMFSSSETTFCCKYTSH